MKIVVEISSDLVDRIDNEILESGIDEIDPTVDISYLRGQIIEESFKKSAENSMKELKESRN